MRGPDAGEALNWASQQEALWQRLVDKPVGFDHGADATLARWLDDRRPVATARGLRVYSDAYATNLRRALAVNFPALARVVSVADFDGMAAAYVRKHPPRGHDFRDLEAHLAAFVRAYPFAETYGVAPEVLAELVAVEQAQIEVLDAVDETPAVAALDLAALDAAQWETARFRFASAVRLVPVTHDVLPVIEAVGRGETPVRPAAIEGAYLVCRAGTALRTERLQAHEAACFAALLEGRSFGAACEVAASDPSADPAAVATDAVRLLVTACARGLLLGVELDGTD